MYRGYFYWANKYRTYRWYRHHWKNATFVLQGNDACHHGMEEQYPRARVVRFEETRYSQVIKKVIIELF